MTADSVDELKAVILRHLHSGSSTFDSDDDESIV